MVLFYVAYARVKLALKSGALVRPDACSRCGGSGNGRIEAHHEDYDKPLDVIWLCKSCHAHVDGVKRYQDPRWRRSMDITSRYAAVRRIAKRRGYTASRSRLRDRLAVGYGQWTLTGPSGELISPPGGWTLEQVEQWLADQQAAAFHGEGDR
jgi:hypothetical protein